MDEREFRKILKKYRLGQASPEERQIIDAWYDASQQEEFAHERKLNDELETVYLKNITDRIGKRVVTHNLTTTRQRKLISFSVAIAASLVLIIWVSQYLILPWTSTD